MQFFDAWHDLEELHNPFNKARTETANREEYWRVVVARYILQYDRRGQKLREVNLQCYKLFRSTEIIIGYTKPMFCQCSASFHWIQQSLKIFMNLKFIQQDAQKTFGITVFVYMWKGAFSVDNNTLTISVGEISGDYYTSVLCWLWELIHDTLLE